MIILVVALQLLVLASTPQPQGASKNVPGPAGNVQAPLDGGHHVASTVVEASTVACTFDHPDYAGQCVENVTPDENQTPMQACGVVLACLNDTRCVKTYCNATTLRGGWKLVAAKPVSE